MPRCFRTVEAGLGRAGLKVTRKAPGALDPAVVLPPPPRGGCKICYGQTQDKSPCLGHDEYLFGRVKTVGLGQVTTKKRKTTGKKGYY